MIFHFIILHLRLNSRCITTSVEEVSRVIQGWGRAPDLKKNFYYHSNSKFSITLSDFIISEGFLNFSIKSSNILRVIFKV